ncbi:UNVERIFIED_ORG: hypothetical protein ABID57_002901 [Arthrobacter sp. UYEF1]
MTTPLCESCLDGLEQYCESGLTGTYGAKDPRNGDAIARGGYGPFPQIDLIIDTVAAPHDLNPSSTSWDSHPARTNACTSSPADSANGSTSPAPG